MESILKTKKEASRVGTSYIKICGPALKWSLSPKSIVLLSKNLIENWLADADWISDYNNGRFIFLINVIRMKEPCKVSLMFMSAATDI